MTILFGTKSGNAEALADARAQSCRQTGVCRTGARHGGCHAGADGRDAQNLLVIASTWGEGDPPQRAIDFFAALMADDAPRFDGMRYAVLALGDRAYAKFCETGRLFDERFAALGREADGRADRMRSGLRGAGRRVDRWRRWACCRPSSASRRPARSFMWISRARRRRLPSWTRTRPFEAEITEHIRLSGSRSTSDTWHVELSLEGAGSNTSRAIRSGSCRATIRRWWMRCWTRPGLPANAATCGRETAEQFDITTLTAPIAAQSKAGR